MNRLIVSGAVCGGLFGMMSWIGLGGSGAAVAPAQLPIKQVLQKLYTAGDTASQRRDIDGMFAYFAPNFVDTDTHGHKSGLTAFKGSLAQVVQAAQSIDSTTVVTSASVQGKTATAYATQDVKIILLNQQTGQPITLGIHAVSKDTWVKTAAGWRESASTTTSETDTLNGKVVDLNAPMPAAPSAPPPPSAAPAPSQPSAPATPAAAP